MKSKIILVLILIAGAAFAFLFFRKPPALPVAQPKLKDYVEIQPVVAGDFVVIPRVVLSKPGFVMIHESDNGQTGRIVMTGDYLTSGEHENVVVHTGITTKPGERYFAMLHEDNGNGQYDDPGVDPPVVVAGAIVQTEFSIVGGITARFEIITNGVNRDFSKSMYHNLSPVAYIDGSSTNEVVVEGNGVTWQEFFDTLPFKIDKTCLTTGTGEKYCTGNEGVLEFFLNGEKSHDALDKVISQGDKLGVRFTSQ